jgi:hypothetical protein
VSPVNVAEFLPIEEGVTAPPPIKNSYVVAEPFTAAQLTLNPVPETLFATTLSAVGVSGGVGKERVIVLVPPTFVKDPTKVLFSPGINANVVAGNGEIIG